MPRASTLCVALASLVVLALATLTAVSSPTVPSRQAAQQTDPVAALERLKQKLDHDTKSKPEDLRITLEEVEQAYELYQNLSAEKKSQIRGNWVIRPVLDLLVYPVIQNIDVCRDPKWFAYLLIKVRLAYKRFSPAYQGKQIGDGSIGIRLNSSSKLYDLLKDSKSTIEMSDFNRASEEASGWAKRLDEITTTEFALSHLDELQDIFNFFNFQVFRPLFDHIYPNLDTYPDAGAARKAYYEILWKDWNTKFVNGQPLTSLNGMQPSEPPGFTNVVEP